MLRTLPIIPSSTPKKIYIAAHYSYFILISLPIIIFVLLFCVLTSRETWTC